MMTMSLQTISSISNKELIDTFQAYAYVSKYGKAICGDSLEVLLQFPDNSIDLVLTSPPFALQRQKEYGNKDQSEYIEWLTKFAQMVYRKLKISGSFILDLGGAYKRGVPARSLYNYRIPIKFCDELGFCLAEEFFWYNPSKLPSPIEWVNKRKIRAKDAVNTVWWFSKSEWPKADITKVLTPYSDRMKKLIKNPDSFYRPKIRPSGHDIGSSFGIDNGGAIPSNLLQIANSDSNSLYFRRCKLFDLQGHPARFPEKLPEFFIRMLTEENDLVVDIFGGSNTTGSVAEQNRRYWITIEERIEYLATSAFRFIDANINDSSIKEIYELIMKNNKINLMEYIIQKELW